ncbi:hypothetical protein [Nitratireductor soli]|uniref:hypothetical protein n=1 Tax=Nitratireductor soli TaxID=1670619 RepID=UPI00065E9452|nr:hypothetical protein [Nitratireductor soli]
MGNNSKAIARSLPCSQQSGLTGKRVLAIAQQHVADTLGISVVHTSGAILTDGTHLSGKIAPPDQ